VEIVLALGSAIAYGVSDYTGGVLTKRARVFNVILLAQLVSCVLIVPVLPFWSGTFSWPGVRWGAVAGVAGVSGAALLYQGLAIGRMGVVAPITAVLAAVLPVTYGLAQGERPGWIPSIGIGLGFVAVVLISRASEPGSRSADDSDDRQSLVSGRNNRGVVEALGAGVGFGLFFILLAQAPEGSGLWPLVGTRASMLASIALLAAVTGTAIRPRAGTGRGLVLLGFTNLGADLLYLLATRAGLLSLVAVITSLYPAATIALARVLLNERMVRQQLVGVAFAALSVVLIALR
jgi:drug/metabolite transporter (DMT)-like permease